MQNIKEHLIPPDSNLMGQQLLQNFKMSFTDFLSILLWNTGLEWNTVALFKEYHGLSGVLKIVKNSIYSIGPTF